MTAWTERALTGAEAAILHHPDQSTPWAPSIIVRLAAGTLAAEHAQERLERLVLAHPIVGARLDRARGAWQARSELPAVELLADELLVLRTRFDLAAGPPVRVALSAAGDALVLVGHHAAVDGRALLMIARALLGAEPIEATAASVASAASIASASDPSSSLSTGGAREAIRRLARPADRVAASAGTVEAESFVAADLPAGTPVRAALLAAAATEAVMHWNHERGERWQQVGLSIPVGGPAQLGNVASHRRVDVALPNDVGEAVRCALRQQVAPPEAGLSPAKARLLRVLAPIVDRLSDSLLVSNLGLVDLPGARAVEFYPQARGRSAVAIGACTPVGGTPRVTLRARDLTELDAGLLLGTVVDAALAAA